MTMTPSITGKFLDPQAILDQCDVQSGWMAADFGCGPGYFSLPLAQMVSNGKVVAFDVLPAALESVESKAKISGIENIEIRRVNLENQNGTGLGDGEVDFVVVKDMLFQNQKKDAILREAWRILKNDGLILIVEWNENDFSIGPDKSLRIAQHTLKEMLKREGFDVQKEVKAGKFHYSFIAKKINKN